MMTGGAWDHIRSAMAALGNRLGYDSMGIETTWRQCKDVPMQSHDARMTVADSYAGLLWDCVFGLARASAQRLLPLTIGFPRRFTLLLSPNAHARDGVIAEFRRHVDNYNMLLEVDAAWADRLKKRSIFNKMTVHQWRLALDLEGWVFTPRTLARA
eukprot:4070099-Pyramimonas_sp.AAC.1